MQCLLYVLFVLVFGIAVVHRSPTHAQFLVADNMRRLLDDPSQQPYAAAHLAVPLAVPLAPYFLPYSHPILFLALSPVARGLTNRRTRELNWTVAVS